MGCLYQLTSPSGKAYIGVTMKTFDERVLVHVLASRNKTHSHKALYRSIKKYGIDAFHKKELVRANDWSYLCDLERKAIAAFNTKSPHGYNLTAGGDGVIGMSHEAIARHLENTRSGTKKAWERLGHKQAHSEARADPEYKKRQSEATKKSRLWDRPEYREKVTAIRKDPSIRSRISVSISALWSNPEYRKNMIEKRRARAPRSEESKTTQSERMRILIAERKAAGTYWLDNSPESMKRKDKLSAIKKAAWEDPISRVRMESNLMKARAAKKYKKGKK
jgi:hypothetical protein